MKTDNGFITAAMSFEDLGINSSDQTNLPGNDFLSSQSTQLTYKLSRAMLDNPNSATLLSDCLDIIQQDTKCTSVSIWFLDEKKASMCPVACSGDPLLTPHITSPDPLESWKNRDLELLRIPLPSSLNKRGILAALARREDAESILHVLNSTKAILAAILELPQIRLASQVDEQAIQVALEVAQEVTWDWDLSLTHIFTSH
ncbi:hypothetical protein K2Y11_18075 [bacterium]|nr:hypothetical protein [bacterium]